MPLRLPAWPIARRLMPWLIIILLSAAGNTEYRLLDINRSGGAENALVLVALSGGGKRDGSSPGKTRARSRVRTMPGSIRLARTRVLVISPA